MKHRNRRQRPKESMQELRLEQQDIPSNHGDLDEEISTSRRNLRYRRRSGSGSAEYEVVGQRVAVIGGGVAGLAAAARLAAQGYRVDLLEAASEPGGKMRDYQADGFRFDGGPSLFTLPEVMEQLFADCGKKMSDYVTYDRLELVTRYFYPDGTQVNAWSSPERLASELELKIGEPAAQVLAFLERAAYMYRITASVFIERSLHDWRNLLRLSTFLRLFAIPRLGIFTSMYHFQKRWLRHERSLQLFGRFATYNGSDPYRAPGTLSMIAHVEQERGAFYPHGGMVALRDALHQLAIDLGVHIRVNTRADRFWIHEKRLKGLLLGAEREIYPIVVCANDILQVQRQQMPRKYSLKRFLSQELSTSAVVFHWAVRGSFPQLDLHNVFFSTHYRREFQHLQRGEIDFDPTWYVYISSKKNPADAPSGFENWFVMANVPAQRDLPWEALVERLREEAFDRLSKALGIDLKSLVNEQRVITPLEMERATGAVGGALYGPASNSRWSAFLRQANRDQRIKGLFYCGGTVHPGGGIPLCLHSAAITADLVARAHPHPKARKKHKR
ncbi:MAG: phytoene desaturase [Bacteroidetes bacterium]|nr:phytoene desaturase [Bacteroidota bacterium]